MSNELSAARQPIAVVGVSALFPGSTDAHGFWRDILAGRDLIRAVPETHWLVEDYYDPDPSAPDKTYANRGAFLDPIDFDALGWGVPPSTIPATDTSQLLALILAQQVLQDAARERFDTMDRSRISVILGVTSAQDLLSTMVSRLQRPVWVKALRESGLPEDEVQAACDRIAAHYVPWQESSFPGLLGNVVAGRVANRLNLGGTNCVTDAACASSFSAIAMAISELQLGHSDLVISGGVDTLNDIFMYMCFSKTPALSPSGDCRPFSDRADGTMLGEGVGMVALKRLADAERDGDRIYAVIRGVGTSSDGRSKSVYAPVPEGQAVALRRAYALAGYGPETVELMEAHGTGTKAGDAAEFEGLCRVFGEASNAKQWAALGSVKSQIGHTKAAAGAAGLFKVIMALHHQVLPPSIKIDAPNPKMGLEESPFYLSTRTRPWIRDSRHPRRASVSAFGFGGSNFHLALEEYRGPGLRAERLATQARQLLMFSAASPSALVERLREELVDQSDLALRARTSQRNFDASAPARACLVATDLSAYALRLRTAIARIESAPGSAFSLPDGTSFGLGAAEGKLAFLCAGQGSQYLEMGAALALEYPLARSVWDRAADVELEPGTGLHEVVFPRPVFGDSAQQALARRLTETRWAQPAIAAVALSQLASLRELGLRPDALGGHSFGEIVALHAAGVFDENALLRIARKRGELMAEVAQNAGIAGAMLALSLPVERVRTLIAAHPALVVANHNAPEQVVVAGPEADIAALERTLEAQRIASKRLPVASAFHSSLVAPACAPFGSFLGGMEFAAPLRPVYANATAEAYAPTAEAMRAGLAQQIASPVRFVEMIEAMYAAGVRSFVEVGPSAVLGGLVGAILGPRAHQMVSLDRKGRDGVESLLIALARLAASGRAMDFDVLHADQRLPVARKPSKHALPITGSNYGKLYPPPGGAAALPKPNPPRPPVGAAMAAIFSSPNQLPKVPVNQPQFEDAAPAPAQNSGASSALQKPETAPVPDAFFHAFQQAQEQTANTHAAFQKAMFESHAAYLRVAETALGSLGMLAGQRPVAVAAPVEPLRVAPIAPVQERPGVSAVALEPAPVVRPQPRVAVPPEPEPSRPRAAIPEIAAPSFDLAALMLQIVAEKTGYPVDMLGLEMDLEGDLGIDSIKRVEILSAIEERSPGANRGDRAHLSGLHTLGEIVSYLQGSAALAPTPTPKSAARQAPIPATAPAFDLAALMLQVVAEKTGYPVDMLGLEMDLEGDLGIDSIKRVEILSAIEERSPSANRGDRAHLSGLHTLGEIVDYLQGSTKTSAHGGDLPPATATAFPTPTPAPAPAPTHAHVQASQPTALGRFRLELIDAPVTGMAQPGLLGGGEVWVVGGGHFNAAVVDELVARGVNAHTADAVPTGATACIYLDGLRDCADIDAAIAINREAFAVARSLASQLTGARGLFVCVQDTGGSFGVDATADPLRPWLSGLPALVKTAALEWPQAACKAIDLERAGRTSEAIARALVDELLEGGGEIEIALPAAGGRFTLASVEAPVNPTVGLIGPGDVVLVSGGARGVTAACIAQWAGDSRARFVLLGRTALADEPAGLAQLEDETALKSALLAEARAHGQSPTPPQLAEQLRVLKGNREIRQTLAAITTAGGEARYLAIDVGDQAALEAALGEIRKQWGPIRGLVHAAGVLADKSIAEKTTSQFDRVFDTKVAGLRTLLAVTVDDPLALLCVFSSVSARCGNTGQSDYAMANEVLAKVVMHEARRRPQLRVKSLGWGPWEGGMVTPHLRTRFAELGVPMIPLEVGARMFADEMRDASGEVELVLGGAPRAEALLFAGASARVHELELNVQRLSHGYLDGHAVNGTPVVPVVLVAEWLSRAARSFRPGLKLAALHEFKVLKGIRLTGFDNGGNRFLIQATSIPDSEDQLQLAVRDAKGQLHYCARAELSAEFRAADNGLPALRLDAWDGEPLYQDLLFHRGSFELIENLDGISDQGVGATVRGVDHAGWKTEPWQLDVAALDGGLQMAVLFGQRMLGGPNLPTAVDEIRVYGAAPSKGLIRAAAYGRKLGSSAVTTDILFTDSQGRRLTELRGVQNHALPSH